MVQILLLLAGAFGTLFASIEHDVIWTVILWVATFHYVFEVWGTLRAGGAK